MNQEVKTNMPINVMHWLKLSGIGGVQSQYSSYISHELELKNSKLRHTTLSIRKIESCYSESIGDRYASGFGGIVTYLRNYRASDTIVHSYNNLTSRKMLPVFKYFTPRKLILHERGNAWNLPREEKMVVQSNCGFADLILTNSEASKQILIQKFDLVSERIEVLQNGVFQLSDVKALSGQEDAKKEGGFRIVYLGRIESNKGLHVLLKAMKALKGKSIELDVIGDGSLKQKMMDYCQENKLANVKFLGRIPNAVQSLSKYDLVIVPSIREPLGNVVIEAAMNRVPVIASAVDGIPEIIKNDWSGILIEPKKEIDNEFIFGSVPLPELVYYPMRGELGGPMELDSKELAEIIVSTLARNDLNEIAERAYSNVVNEFSLEKYSASLLKHYEHLIAG